MEEDLDSSSLHESDMKPRALPLPPIATKSIPHSSFLNLLQSASTDSSSTRNTMINTIKVNGNTRPSRRDESYIYTYTLEAARAPLDFTVCVEPTPNNPGHYFFKLSLKADAIERTLCEPVAMRLTVDPTSLDFSVFMFPPKASLPEGCLHALRVWLHVNGVDHRLFAEDELWVGKEPDFSTIADASFALLKGRSQDTEIWQGSVGGVPVNFVLRWHRLEFGLYNLTLEYEAGGAGRMLMDCCPLRLGCLPHAVSFVLYTVPVRSLPPGASHRLRLWIRSVPPSLAAGPPVPYICQRIWKCDEFKIGRDLNFGAISSKTIMGVLKGGVVLTHYPPLSSAFANLLKETASDESEE